VQWQISALVLHLELADPNAADLRASILGVASRNYLIRLLDCQDKDLVFVTCAIAIGRFGGFALDGVNGWNSVVCMP